MSDLWQPQRQAQLDAAAPLAVRMRPRDLDEFAGQTHFLGQGKLLRRMLLADCMTSVLFYGPPGTGKTTLAELIAKHTGRHYERANATSIGVKDIRRVIDDALNRLTLDGRKTILFLDEIHRFNKAQQDVLLGDVERGTLTLIGATTENPFYAVNNALISRSQVFQFQPLDPPDIIALLQRAITDTERGYGQLALTVTEDALNHWATSSDGDARRALTALEIAVLSTLDSAKSQIPNPKSPSTSPSPRNPSSKKHCNTIATATDITTPFPHSSNPCAAPIPTPPSIGSPACSRLAKTPASSPAESPSSLPRTWATPTLARSASPPPHMTFPNASGSPSAASLSPRPRFTWPALPNPTPATPPSTPPWMTSKTNAPCPFPSISCPLAKPKKKRMGHGTGYQYAHNSDKGHVEQDYLGVDKTYYTPTTRGYEKRITDYLNWLHQPPQTEQHENEPNQTSEN